MATQPTRFGSLRHYEKGGVEVIKDDPRNYVFSNVFEVAARARPYEKVAVGKNIEYVIEAIRAEGTSGWRVAAQDEFALVMDGEVEIRLVKPDDVEPVHDSLRHDLRREVGQGFPVRRQPPVARDLGRSKELHR